jgi:hypothetical protein
MSWGTRKRNFIVFIFLTTVFFVMAVFAGIYFYEEPTCFDRKQNGDEIGIDCGGSCELLCNFSTTDPIIHWVRYFKIAEGIYSVIAYVENQNTNASVKNLPYVFKLYDSRGVVLIEKEGSVNLNAKQIIPISETGLKTGVLEPVRVSFDFTKQIVWQKDETSRPTLIIKDEQIVDDKEVQKITAEALNASLEDTKNINFLVIVYDNNNNAIASSATFIDEIRAGESKNLLFTWPTLFTEKISHFEIIPLYQ